MPRMPRIKLKEEPAYYLITSHVVWEKKKAFSSFEKSYFISLLRKLTLFYLVEVLAFVVMDNHFHLVVKTLPASSFTDEEITQRVKNFYNDKKLILLPGQIDYWRARLEDLSQFIKDLKQRFAQWYNRRYDRKGHLWCDRFHSVLLEKGEAVLLAMAYVDLNCVRARMVKKPSAYQWCSYTYRLAAANWLASLKEIGLEGLKTLEDYKSFLKLERERIGMETAISETVKELALCRVKYITFALVMGSRHFVENTLKRLKSLPFKNKKIVKLPMADLHSV